VLEFKQDLSVQLDAFLVGVFNGHDVSLRNTREIKTSWSWSWSSAMNPNYRPPFF